MSGCGNANCNCGASCSGCNCKKNMDDSMITTGFECDTPGCACNSCSNCAPSCGCSSCSCK
ncbi:hypothetical protein MPTK1_3g10650 [Marchantia polymorpha subsp. ruderalis]|uniref:Uncharacterized protein n=2 Tax=Marchantia polymorpha TaxID=3197 RepID=A0AAF6AZF7_MARPO|nr:hypothetical protein MARPO_0037s0131 [Marchantia polymorpha]BBN05141.1 hypothetical protein Mp_3g10650 [Marchantia polymorpha subsp. ruderalis]|eukprot:PTQ40963.1 hypothetical protein MARPO_0037s0131 [Marchantia polymorpha]